MKHKAKYKNDRYMLFLGKSESVLKSLPSNSVHAVVTDPPYELGFMGKKWDNSGIAYNVELWKEVLRVLKPGGHLLSFSGSRTYHRMVCAIEDAGFEVRDQIMWLYGCLDDQTECLTQRGWLKHSQLTSDDCVMQWDCDTGNLSWAKPKQIMRYDYTGQLEVLSNRHTHQVLTPNHRVYAKVRRHSRHPVPVSYEVFEASHIANRSSAWQVDLPMAGNFSGSVEISPDTAYIVGWWMTDAWAHRDGKACMFSQSKPATLGKLRTALAPHNPSEYTKKPKKKTHAVEHTFYLTGSMANYLLREHPKRKLVWSMLDWKFSARLALLEGLIDGDGSRPKDQHTVSFWSLDRERRDIVTALALSVGWRAFEDAQKGCVHMNTSTCTTQIQAKHASAKLDYDGIVWCVRVPAGAFVVRRNGRPFITGNSGFPKSMDVSKAIDKAAGATREVVGSKVGLPGYSMAKDKGRTVYSASGRNSSVECAITAPATDAARQWSGWGTALKPAHEPICVARKPLVGTVAANVLAHGAGALNIDACRVGTDIVSTHSRGTNAAFPKRPGETTVEESGRVVDQREKLDHSERVGRWPANVIHDGSDVVEAAFAAHGEKGGQDKRKGLIKGTRPGGFGNVGHAKGTSSPNGQLYGDSGTASRFFYCAKTSAKDRHEGLENPGPQLKHGTTLRKVEKAKTKGNNHPTVKPTELMRYLVRLVTPPGGIILDPFMGSGSTGKAAMLEGFKFAGIDMTDEYVEIARARIRHAREQAQAKKSKSKIFRSK